MDVENMSVRLTADADGFNATIDSAKNSLSAFAIEERSLQTQQATLNRAIATNADKVELLGSKCNTLSQKIAAQNQKIQQATAKYGENSAQVIRLREGLVRLENQYNSQNTKLEKAQAQSGKLAEQLKNVQAREQELSESVKRTNNSLDEQQKKFVQTAQKGDSLGNQLKSTFLMLKGLAVGYAGKTLFNALIGSNAGDTAVSAAEEQADALEKIKDNLSTVQTALDELKENKKINISTMEELIKTYPELIECLDDEKELQDALIQKENEEKSNYLSVLQEKYVNTVLFGDNVSAENKRLIDNLAEAYGVDGKNFQSMADIKLEIDNLLLHTLGENWSQFYGSQAEALRGFINNMNSMMGPLTAYQAESLAKAATRHMRNCGSTFRIWKVKCRICGRMMTV